MAVRQDEMGWTHIDWELEGITPKMINWWWCNLEKGFALWHPIEHTDFYWHTQANGKSSLRENPSCSPSMVWRYEN